ncbi:very-long-chain enoyl-CoA reductase [Physcomitrium patens]|uniref:Enoyl-CoA reductase n=1 Tax=Physcomitrium patens TaxID=3218 RepID=A9RLI4_PHYPA|nr:very-long-chain enoyl-CoA reductase-like [Physcomitrium patens]PNR37388.1 hypothetical protein PHYPA_020497 [Physcomitrium patens]QKE45400.1 enoyl-CoA reductase [Physcomitrium patens]|eukprot:XP_024398727.1 very-long-chain enoyl-CoA reductase-like [Physcomitrella patens]
MGTEKNLLVQVVGRNGKEIIKGGVEVSSEATLEDLKKVIYSRNKKFYLERQRLTLPLQPGQSRPTPVDESKKLKDQLSSDQPQVVFKDLGPQVSYKILFCFEYLGPLVIYPLFYFFPQIYTYVGLPLRKVTHPVQTYALYAWCFHYAKREFETFCIHRFSHATSPLSNVYRNCAYYWLFGALIAYFVNHPLYTPVSEKQMYVGLAISIVSQLSNFYCHIILKNLRSPDGKGGYQIPYGFLFNYVTCANYTTEIWQWIGFNIATQTVAGYLFLAAAGYIMSVWALQKHKRLKKTFDGKDGRKKYPRRFVIFPPLL